MEGFFAPCEPEIAPDPKLLFLNDALARDLGLEPDSLDGSTGAEIFSGNRLPGGAEPIAQAYAGHQFGGFSPQLGDGRALLLGEIVAADGLRRDIQLKGSGRTPFSRGGDGKAVLGPVLREYLLGEAMHALGIPTTRALAAVITGETIERDGPKPGAILTRVAASHLRVGTFQFFAARGQTDQVRQLADYAIARHYSHLTAADDKYLAFLSAVIDAQVAMVARWMQVGFVHGVMNTDNVAISGETIDFGPCAFIDAYDPATVFSSIDRNGRYALGNQPSITQWNMARLADCLLPLIHDDADEATRIATEMIASVPGRYVDQWLSGMRPKIGLSKPETGDDVLINEMFLAMAEGGADYTQFFRRLADASGGETEPLLKLFTNPDSIKNWLAAWKSRLTSDPQSATERKTAMNAVNPLHIPRNHLVQAALDAAEDGDLAPFRTLLDVVTSPYDPREGWGQFERPAAASFGPYTTFCGT